MPAQTRRTQGIYHYQFFLEDRSSGATVTKDISIAEIGLGWNPETWDRLSEEDRLEILWSATNDWLQGHIDYGWVTKPATPPPPLSKTD